VGLIGWPCRRLDPPRFLPYTVVTRETTAESVRQMKGTLVRLAPLTGLVFAGLLFVAVLVSGNTPDSNWSGARVAVFYVNHQDSQNAGAYLFAFAGLFALFFAAALSSHLRARASALGAAAVGFAGAVTLAVGLSVAAASTFALTDSPTAISPAANQALNVISNDFFVTVEVGAVAFLAGYGIAVVWAGALPRWLGWVAIVLAIASAIPPLLPIAGLLLLVWLVIVSVLMFIREGRSPTSLAAATQES
jgi:hypothetical protein